MDDLSPAPMSPAALKRAGEMLRLAREEKGLSLAEVAARTRIPQRHLQAIEDGEYADLPSQTYASGFAKAYARAVDLDEVAIGRQVRGELAGVTRRTPEYQPYEATDPARVPSRGLTIAALVAAIAVLILGGLYFGTTLFRGGSSAAPAPIVADAGAPVTPVATATAISTGVPADGQVVVTATDEVWLRIYDADGNTLHQGTLHSGGSFEVPAGARDPQINVGRPDKIRITINGAAVEGLNLGRDPIKDVRVSAAALSARVAGTPSLSPSATATDTPRPTETRAPERRREASERRPDRPQNLGRRDTLAPSETQRANIEAAPTPAPAGNTQ